MPEKDNSNSNPHLQQNPTIRDLLHACEPVIQNVQTIMANPAVQAEMQRATREEYYKKLKPMKIKPLILRIRKLKISFGPFILGKILLKI